MSARVMVLADGEPIRNGVSHRITTWPSRAAAEAYVADCARMWAPLALSIGEVQATDEVAA